MKKTSRFSVFYVILVLVLLYLPMAVVIVYSFNSTKLFRWEGFSLEWYQKLFNNEGIMTSLRNSVFLAIMSSALAALLGTVGASALAGRFFRGKGALESLSLIPIMIPEIILGMAYLAFFSALGVPFGMLAMVMAHTTFCVPYIFVNVKARLSELDPSLEEAARDLGAGGGRAFWDITLPLIAPAVGSGAMLAFAMSMDDVVISFFVTGATTNTLPLQVYSMLKMGVTPEINALCTVMLGSVFLILALFRLGKSMKRRAARPL